MEKRYNFLELKDIFYNTGTRETAPLPLPGNPNNGLALLVLEVFCIAQQERRMLDYQPDLTDAAKSAAAAFANPRTAIVQQLSTTEPEALQGAESYLQATRTEKPETITLSIRDYITTPVTLVARTLVERFLAEGAVESTELYTALSHASMAVFSEVLATLNSSETRDRVLRGTVKERIRQELQLAPAAIQSEYLAGDSLPKMLEAIPLLPQREALLLDLHVFSMTDVRAANELARYWDNAIHALPAEERTRLANTILTTHQDSISYNRVARTLQCSETLEELCASITVIGEEKLLASGNAELRELCAIAYLYPRVGAVSFPAPPDKHATSAESRACLTAVISAYEDILDICLNAERFKHTRTASELGLSAVSSIADAKIDLYNWELRLQTQRPQDSSEGLSPGAIPLLLAQNAEQKKALRTHLDRQTRARATPQASAPEQLRKDIQLLAASYVKIATLEHTYGLNFTYANTTILDLFAPAGQRGMPLWTLEELDAIETGLKAIPLEHTLFSKKLCEIQKVSSIGPGVLAARYADGKIQITPEASSSKEMATHYPDIHPLSMVFVHELGHSIQLGGETGGLYHDENGAYAIEPGELKYDFEHFITLAGWQVIGPEDFTLILSASKQHSVKVELDGNEYEIGKEITHNGERIVLQLHPSGRALFAFSATGAFPSRWYARTTPWEDYAETFAEYMLVPELLIDSAPIKFQFMESEFKKYANNSEIKKRLQTKLIESTTRSLK